MKSIELHPEPPWAGLAPFDVPAHTHGGVTYAKPCAGEICHVPEAGEPDHLFWIGFDTAHVGRDVVPAFLKLFSGTFDFPRRPAPVYRTFAYVVEQTEALAQQAAAAQQGARGHQAGCDPEVPALPRP